MLSKMDAEADAPSGTPRAASWLFARLVGPVGPVPAMIASGQALLPSPLAGPTARLVGPMVAVGYVPSVFDTGRRMPSSFASGQTLPPTPLTEPWPPAASANAASAKRGGATAAVDRLRFLMTQDGHKTLADFEVRVCLSRLQTAHAHKAH